MDSNNNYDLIVKNAMIYTMDREGRVIRRGSAAVRGDRIALISEGELPESAQARQLIDAEATVVYASSEENIDTTIVNGEIVYHKGVFKGGLTEAELVREIAVEVERMRARCPAKA